MIKQSNVQCENLKKFPVWLLPEKSVGAASVCSPLIKPNPGSYIMEWKDINLPEYKGMYRISEYGDIYSVRKQRLLKPVKHGICYPCYVSITLTAGRYENKCFYIHTLVALHFIGPKPTPKYEINHRDMVKNNNHYTNLEWVTHTENLRKAREMKPWHTGRDPGYKLTEEHKRKLSLRKMKKILLISDTQEIILDSITDTCEHLDVCRKTFNRYVNSHKTINGFKLRYA